MRSTVLSLLMLMSTSVGTVLSQDMKFAGTHDPDKEVIDLIAKYQAASTNWKAPKDRDEKRRPLVSAGYIYHGWDGKPIGFDGLTARNTKNSLHVAELKITDVTLFQYENSAIVTFISVSKGVNQGKPFEDVASHLVIISKEKGAWKVTADVIGQEPDQQDSGTKKE